MIAEEYLKSGVMNIEIISDVECKEHNCKMVKIVNMYGYVLVTFCRQCSEQNDFREVENKHGIYIEEEISDYDGYPVIDEKY